MINNECGRELIKFHPFAKRKFLKTSHQNIYISIDISLIMTILQKKSENIFARSPTLDTVLMIKELLKNIRGNLIKQNYGKNFLKKLCGKLICSSWIILKT